MSLIDRARSARRLHALYAVTYTLAACLGVAYGDTWFAPYYVAAMVMAAMYQAYQWRKVTDLLNHPLLYLVMVRDQFGGGS